jgi:sigma-B regulation protein RsbU (phosphoserine phosphatase)
MVGVLSAFNKKLPDVFSESDQRLLTIIASQSAQVIENARLYEEEKALQLMQQELRVAHDIQTKLLPADAPSVPGYEIGGATLPASNVGGDYYDFIPCGKTQMAICLGDVAGKGIPAAVLMACVQATIRAQTLLESSAAACLERSNQLLHRSTDAGRFVTLFYGILDPESHRFRYSNAGHNPPVLLSSEHAPRLLTAGGPVLGVLPDFRFEEADVSLDPGDLIVIFSDGFTEAMNLSFEEFGEARLLETLEKNRHRPVKEMVEATFAAIRQHAGTASQHDDMTIVMLRRVE